MIRCGQSWVCGSDDTWLAWRARASRERRRRHDVPAPEWPSYSDPSTECGVMGRVGGGM